MLMADQEPGDELMEPGARSKEMSSPPALSEPPKLVRRAFVVLFASR